MQIVAAKTTTLRTLCAHVNLNSVVFLQILYIIKFCSILSFHQSCNHN